MKLFAASLLIAVCLSACGDAQTTTLKPTTTTTKPSTTATKPTTTTTKPTTTTTKPTTTTTKPTTTTTKAVPTTTLPTTTTKPVPTTTKPVPTTQPTTTTTKPVPTTQPTTTTTKPVPTTQPTTTTTKPVPTTTQPTTTTTKPVPTTTQPNTTTTKPVPTTTTPARTTTVSAATATKPTVTTTIPSTQNSYCNIATCSVPSDNTLCKYSNTTWGAACLPPYPTKSNINDAEIVIILKAHNDYRRQVAQGLETRGNPGPQPAASNMRQLIWDEELAVMAQTHAQQCVFQHDKCRNVARFRVGQNIYVGGSSADNLNPSNWTAAVTSWYNEVDAMTAAYVTSFPSSPPSVIGHYTQLVWANSYTVGCGVAYYQSTATFGVNFPYNRLYVCNYGPAGNFLNSAVYTQGTAGSACPAPTTNNNGLCA